VKLHHNRVECLLHSDWDARPANPEPGRATCASRSCSAFQHHEYVPAVHGPFGLVMNITGDKARAEERTGPDIVASASVNRDTGGAKIPTIVGRCGCSYQPEDEQHAVDCKLGPSIPGKEMG
jgi:hypothetical protein